MLSKEMKQFSPLFYITTISCFGVVTHTNAAALAGPTKVEFNIHLDQQLDQNQTETEPDLSQKPPQPSAAAAASTNSSHTITTTAGMSAINIIKDRLSRQEVGQQVGNQVGSIITGVLGGGLSNVFQGSASFIEDVDAREQVNYILGNVAPPFETVLKYGFQGLKQVFGIGVTTPKTVVITHPPSQELYLQPVVFENGTVQYIPIIHTVTKPPTVVTVTNPPAASSEDNELEDIDENAEKFPLSRVDRLH